MSGTQGAQYVAVFVLACLLLLALAGCAQPYWHRDIPGYEPRAIQVTRLDSAATLSAPCRMPRSDDAACSFRFQGAEPRCLVYLGPQADACALSHEMRHCRGWNHAPTQVFRQDCG